MRNAVITLALLLPFALPSLPLASDHSNDRAYFCCCHICPHAEIRPWLIAGFDNKDFFIAG